MNRIVHQQQDFDIYNLLAPETKLEQQLLSFPEFQEGLNWGIPRYGHPEGKVGLHIREVLNNIDQFAKCATQRAQLRLIAFVHDTFKYLEDTKRQPRDWSKHHGVYARRYLERFTNDESLLDIVELHDEAYYIWRDAKSQQGQSAAHIRLEKLQNRIHNNMPLYFAFFLCDTKTGDKNQAPLEWFTKVVSKGQQ